MHRLGLLPSAPLYPTASELHRAAECVAPWALGLPEAEEPPGEWAEFGRRCHYVAEMLARGELAMAIDEALPLHKVAWSFVQDMLASDLKAAALEHVTQRLRQTAWYVEQGVAWRPGFPDDEAKLVQREPGERLRGWFSGTVDLAYVRADGVLVVADWKFGERTRWIGEPAEEHSQLWFLALALCQALEIRGTSAGVVVARIEARHVSENGIHVDAHELTQGDLDGWANSLRKLAKRIDAVEGAQPRLSAACGRCKAKAECPAWLELGARVWQEVGGDVTIGFAGPPRSPEAVRALYHAVEAADAAVENWREWIKAWCLMHEEGVEIGLGLKLQAREKASRAVVQTPEAMALIEQIAGPAAIEVKKKSSIAAIEKAAKDSAGAGIASKSDRDKARKRAAEDAVARCIEGGAILEKGARYGVSVVRSDGEETAWIRGDEE